MNQLEIKKLEEESKSALGEKLDAINLKKSRLKQINLEPHQLFMKFFNAFIEKKTEEVNDLLDLVEAFYKPMLSKVQKKISELERKEQSSSAVEKEEI